MDEELLKTIKANKIFASLDANACQELCNTFTKIELNSNDFLFRQGDRPDGFFLLLRGKLVALLTTAEGDIHTVGHIDAGDSLGETGALTGEARSLSIKAVSPATLYRLSNEQFINLCHQHPAIMFAAIHPIMMRSRELMEVLSVEKVNNHIILLPANRETSLAKFTEVLQHQLEDYPNLTLIADNPDWSQEELKQEITRLQKSKKKSHKFLYLLNAYDTPLAKMAFKKASHFYVVAEQTATPRFDNFILDKFTAHNSTTPVDVNLILFHTQSTLMPHNTMHWLSKMPFRMYHHVRMNVAKDFSRLLRFLRGKAVGIVLSGGGTRGWAHLGALKAILDEDIPIDMIGGTSVGAMIAACYALYESYEDTYERFSKIALYSKHSISWRSLTWPAVSLFNAKNFTNSQIEVFGDRKIEDLWLPFFCVSCNLATSDEEIHRTGTLWQKTRASSSIPGLIPPMLLNNEIQLDGGLLNNLPVDIMRSFLGKKAKIIAIELNSFSMEQNKYDFPPILTFKQALLAKLGFSRESYRFPRFVDTFLRGLFIGSTAKSRQNSLAANILVSLELSNFRMLTYNNAKQIEKLIQLGYDDTLNQLRQVKNKT